MRTVERLKRQLVTLKIKPELVDGVWVFQLKGLGTVRARGSRLEDSLWKGGCQLRSTCRIAGVIRKIDRRTTDS